MEETTDNSSTLVISGPVCYLPAVDSNKTTIDNEYLPQDYSLTEQYTELQVLCAIPLAPTIISLAIENDSNTQVVKKSILKDKLFSENSYCSARTEAIIQS